jgi:hypothetical protein
VGETTSQAIQILAGHILALIADQDKNLLGKTRAIVLVTVTAPSLP